MTESTSHVEQQVQQRIEQARIRVAAAKQRRDDLAAARRRGLAARHANKLRRLADAERQADGDPDEQDGPVTVMTPTPEGDRHDSLPRRV